MTLWSWRDTWVFHFWKFLLGSKLLTATCHHWKGQCIWSTCQTWHFFLREDNCFKQFAPSYPENHSVVLGIFLAPPHLIRKSGKGATVWRARFCQVITLMSFCSTSCTPDSNYLATIAHPWVRQWRSSMCRALSLALVWSPFFIPVKAATPSVATFAQFFRNTLVFIHGATSCWE